MIAKTKKKEEEEEEESISSRKISMSKTARTMWCSLRSRFFKVECFLLRKLFVGASKRRANPTEALGPGGRTPVSLQEVFCKVVNCERICYLTQPTFLPLTTLQSTP
jgi:hypothetical protein